MSKPRPTTHGFERLAQHFGVDAAGPAPDAAPTAAQGPASTADTQLFPALCAHRFEQTASGLRETARAAADRLHRRRGHRRRRRGSSLDARSKPKAEDGAVPELLGQLGLEPLSVDTGPDRLTLRLDPALAAGLPPVPEGYGFKGGVARKALAQTLRLNISTAAVRDIDLLRTIETPGDQDASLAHRYMPDDLTFSEFGIEILDVEAGYFGSRELTLNEVLLLGDRLTVSHACLLDTLGLTLRVTKAHLTKNRGHVHPGVALKTLRFAANLAAEGNKPRVLPLRVTPRPMRHGFDFYVALHLSRAFENGEVVAAHYLRLVAERGLLKRARLPESATPRSAARILKKRLASYHLEFPEEL